MPEPSGGEQPTWQERRYRRFELRFPVHLLFRLGELTSAVEAVSRNVCIGGLLLECSVRIPQHSAVSFLISVETLRAHPVELVGEGDVVRVEGTRVPGEFAVALECKKPITQVEAYFSG